MEQNNNNGGADDTSVELAQLTETPEANIRAELAKEYGLEDNDANKNALDKAVQREMKKNADFRNVVKQKISYREKYQAASGVQKPNTGTQGAPNGGVTEEQLKANVRAEMQADRDARFLNKSGYTDEIKAAIKEIAAFKKIEAEDAAATPYIKSLIEAEAKAAKARDAVSRGSQGGARTGDPSSFSPSNYNLGTKEGREAYKADRSAFIAHKKATHGK